MRAPGWLGRQFRADGTVRVTIAISFGRALTHSTGPPDQCGAHAKPDHRRDGGGGGGRREPGHDHLLRTAALAACCRPSHRLVRMGMLDPASGRHRGETSAGSDPDVADEPGSVPTGRPFWRRFSRSVIETRRGSSIQRHRDLQGAGKRAMRRFRARAFAM
jgi:hypothetical protein